MQAYNAALANLQSEKPIIVHGAILALERLAREIPSLHDLVYETLCTFVRTESPFSWNKKQGHDAGSLAPKIIQPALTVIGRRDVWRDGKNGLIDLSCCNLSGVNLCYADLRTAIFCMSDISKSTIINANLKGADFRDSNISQSVLKYTNLSWANLEAAYLKRSNLRYANLKDSNIWRADFSHSYLMGIDIDDDYLEMANFDNATIDAPARLPPD